MYFDLLDYQFPFFSQISASTVSKQIARKHFGLNFEADSDRTVSVCSQKPKCDDDPLSLLVVGAVTIDGGGSRVTL